MTVDGLLVGPGPLHSLYGGVPDLTGVRIRPVDLKGRGPTVTLRVASPSSPHAAKVDSRRHTALPDTDEKTF